MPNNYNSRNNGGRGGNAQANAYPQENATAPYNFVSLLDTVLASPLNKYKDTLLNGTQAEWRNAFKEYLDPAANELFSGSIELELTTRTSMFIGGNKEAGEFYAPNGEPIIPGSTLRGFTKNLLKLISCGAVRPNEDFYDRHIYYRCLMAPGRDNPNRGLLSLYSGKMTSTDEDGKVKKNAKPGFLVKINDKYYVYPTVADKVKKILIRDFIDENRYSGSKSGVYWKDSIAYCVTEKLDSPRVRARFKTQEEIDEFFISADNKAISRAKDSFPGYSIVELKRTREYKNAKQREYAKIGKQRFVYMDVKTDLDEKRRYEVPDNIINEYRDDKNRGGVDLLDEKSGDVCVDERAREICPLRDVKISSIVPCFYFLDGGKVKTFGHGQSFRIPYDNAISDAISDKNKVNTIDFADAIFGRLVDSNTWTEKGYGQIKDSKSWASRVFFEDAAHVGSVKRAEKAEQAHALMQPNPTSFQLYLEQGRDKNRGALVHWDCNNASVRGYKLYWHSADKPNWQVTPAELDNVQNKDIFPLFRPLLSGNVFRGRIRFENLRKEELGALLKVFNLGTPERSDIVYKMGHGKSIGLGSVNIETKLLLEDASRYRTLFDETGWHNSQRETSPDEYIKAYEDYVKAQKCTAEYEKVVDNLCLMLDYTMTKNPKWEEATRAMPPPNTRSNNDRVGSFMQRNVLPSVRAVVNKVKGKQ